MRRIRPEFGALFGPNKSIGAGENIFALDSAPVGISLVPFVRWADGRNLVTSSIRRRFGVRISASWAGSPVTNTEGSRAAGGTLAACGKRCAFKATPHLYFDGISASSTRSSGRKIPSDRKGSTHT